MTFINQSGWSIYCLDQNLEEIQDLKSEVWNPISGSSYSHICGFATLWEILIFPNQDDPYIILPQFSKRFQIWSQNLEGVGHCFAWQATWPFGNVVSLADCLQHVKSPLPVNLIRVNTLDWLQNYPVSGTDNSYNEPNYMHLSRVMWQTQKWISYCQNRQLPFLIRAKVFFGAQWVSAVIWFISKYPGATWCRMKRACVLTYLLNHGLLSSTQLAVNWGPKGG